MTKTPLLVDPGLIEIRPRDISQVGQRICDPAKARMGILGAHITRLQPTWTFHEVWRVGQEESTVRLCNFALDGDGMESLLG